MNGNDRVKCENCGAEIDIHSPKCPYCGYINPTGAEEKYMGELEEVRLRLDNVDEEASGEYKKSLFSGTKMALTTFLIMIGAIVALFVLYMFFANLIDSSFPGGKRSAEDQMKELAAEKEFFPRLDEVYDSGDVEALVELAYSDKAREIDIWNYDHYELIASYADYMKVRDDFVPALDKGALSREKARFMTEIVFSFYYRCYDNTTGFAGKSTEEDKKVLDGIRDDYMLGILHDRMGYTDEDMEAARNDLTENGFLHSSETDKISDRYFERYR